MNAWERCCAGIRIFPNKSSPLKTAQPHAPAARRRRPPPPPAVYSEQARTEAAQWQRHAGSARRACSHPRRGRQGHLPTRHRADQTEAPQQHRGSHAGRSRSPAGQGCAALYPSLIVDHPQLKKLVASESQDSIRSNPSKMCLTSPEIVVPLDRLLDKGDEVNGDALSPREPAQPSTCETDLRDCGQRPQARILYWGVFCRHAPAATTAGSEGSQGHLHTRCGPLPDPGSIIVSHCGSGRSQTSCGPLPEPGTTTVRHRSGQPP
jgi:hypothetical protein